MSSQLGHYEIVKELGRGGMGVVYLARDTTLDRQVALKVLSQPIADDDVMVQRFLREARSAAALNHPNIVQVYFIGKEGDKHFFVMEFVKGQTLTELIKKQGTVPPEQAAQLILQAASGLAAAHDAGIFHRDIKPSNLILDEHGLVKIADFGIAFKQEVGQKLTATGQFLGTPGYLCPEICLGEQTDQRSDIFSLGIVLFELLTGFSPFEADSPMAMMHKVVTAEVPDVTGINTLVDFKLKAILKKMVEKDRKNRYQDCHLLLKDLESFLGIRRSQIGTRPYVAAQVTDRTVSMSKPPQPSAQVTPPGPPPVSPSPVAPPPHLAAPPVAAMPQPMPGQYATESKDRGILLWAFLLLFFLSAGGVLAWYLYKRQSAEPSIENPSVASQPLDAENGSFSLKDDQDGDSQDKPDVDTLEGVTENGGYPEDPSSADAFESVQEENSPFGEATLETTVESNVEATETASIAAPEQVPSKTDPMSLGSPGKPSQTERGIRSEKDPISVASPSKLNPVDLQNRPVTDTHANQKNAAAATSNSQSFEPSFSDLFRSSPVEPPKEPKLFIQVNGDDLLADPLLDALVENYNKRGYSIIHQEKGSLESGNGSLSAYKQLQGMGRSQDADLVVFVQIQPVSRLGINYGSRYQTGYRVNTISRIKAQTFLPRQNRPGLTSWSKTLNYNPDTAQTEAETTAEEMAGEWMGTAFQALPSTKPRVVISGTGDEFVSEAVLQYLEQQLQAKGYPVLSLNDLGFTPGKEPLGQLEKSSGARVFIQISNQFLSDEQIEAYGQSSVLSTYRVKVSYRDLKAPANKEKKKTQNFKFSAMSLDGEAELLAKETFSEIEPFLKAIK